MIFQNKTNQNGSKFSVLLIAVVAFISFSFAQDISIDEIISKNIEARGGKANWEKVKTIKMTGTYVNFSNPEEFVIYKQRPDLYRFDTERLNRFTIHAFDGKKAWWVNPLMGEQFAKPSFIPAEGNLAKVTLRERFFDPVFWNYKAKGNKIEFAGTENLDGEDVYKLKVILKDKSVEFWYISAETFLEVSMTGTTYDFGRAKSYEVFFSEYQKVENVMMPYLIESEYGIRYRSLEIKEIEINKNVDASVFKKPDPATWKK
ncbi:MAG: outer membrane lipoprotein carrier protein LolA [Rhodothermaceae bacterium]